MRTFDVSAAVLLVIGGIDWGLVGLLGLYPIAALLDGDTGAITRLAYVAVGSAALYQVVSLRRIQERWGVDVGPAADMVTRALRGVLATDPALRTTAIESLRGR
jgi:hypothetical protein